MRALLALVAIVAGCGGSVTRSASSLPSDDPLAQSETALSAETLPGALAGPWPIAIARGAGGWLVPWHDADGVHARFIGDDGTRADRFVDGGALVGAAALGDGFVVAVTDGPALRVHFFAGDRDDVRALALDGSAVPSVASDGARALVAVTRGGEIAVEDPRPLYAALLLVGRDGARAIELGRVAAVPSLWGDARGFVVGGTLLVDGAGALGPAPGRQIRDARLFRAPFAAGTQPLRDRVSLDGGAWLDVDGLVGWAERSDGRARLEVVRADGRFLFEVGDDLTPLAMRALPATARGDGGQSWVATAAAGRVLWASTVENDPVFARLDAGRMRPGGGVVRLRGASSRSTVTSAGPTSVLLAWTEGRSTVRYALVPW